MANNISHLASQTGLLFFPIFPRLHPLLRRPSTLLVFSILFIERRQYHLPVFQAETRSHSWSSFPSQAISKLLANAINSTSKTYPKPIVNFYWVYSWIFVTCLYSDSWHLCNIFRFTPLFDSHHNHYRYMEQILFMLMS